MDDKLDRFNTEPEHYLEAILSDVKEHKRGFHVAIGDKDELLLQIHNISDYALLGALEIVKKIIFDTMDDPEYRWNITY